MKKKESVNLTLEELDREAQKRQAEREIEEMKEREANAQPSLMKRIGVGLLDFLFTAILATGIFGLIFLTAFEPLGYNKAADTVFKLYEESALFVEGDTGLVKITEHYDDTKSPIENYDVPITHYYSTNPRAIVQHKLDEYVTRKVNSPFFEFNSDNECVLSAGVIKEQLKTFLEEEYLKAVDYFADDPEFSEATKTTFYIMVNSILISVVISSSIFYLLIPGVDKADRTLGYMIGKMMVVSKKDMSRVEKKKLMFRNIIFVVVTYISPVTIFMLFGTFDFCLIPLFVNVILLSVTKSNTGMHDIAIESITINRSLSNEFTILEQIKKSDNQY